MVLYLFINVQVFNFKVVNMFKYLVNATIPTTVVWFFEISYLRHYSGFVYILCHIILLISFVDIQPILNVKQLMVLGHRQGLHSNR